MPRLFWFALAASALAAPKPPAQFTPHTVASDLKGGYQVVVTDMNRDGKPDLLVVASGMTDLLWFENPGWQRHVIASNLPRMINVAALDTDGDGIPELVVSHLFENQAKKSAGVVSVVKAAADPNAPWTVTEIDRIPTSHRLRWADIDGSGKKVLVNAPLTGAKAEPPDYRDHTPLVFYRPGEWKRQVISEAEEGVVHGIYVMDWNGDRRDDILTAGFLGIHVYSPSKDGTWQRTEISKGDPAAWPKGGSSDVAVGKVRGKRVVAAVEPWHGHQVAVYNARGKEWQRAVIDDQLADGHTILFADLNGDGDDEIVAGYRGGKRGVNIYSAGKKGAWTKAILDEGGVAAAACTAADLNGDGRLDLICIGSATTNLKWYENRAR